MRRIQMFIMKSARFILILHHYTDSANHEYVNKKTHTTTKTVLFNWYLCVTFTALPSISHWSLNETTMAAMMVVESNCWWRHSIQSFWATHDTALNHVYDEGFSKQPLNSCTFMYKKYNNVTWEVFLPKLPLFRHWHSSRNYVHQPATTLATI